MNKTRIYHKLRYSDLLNVVVSAAVFVFSASHVHGNRSISFHNKQNYSLFFLLLFIPAADFDKPSVSYCNDEETLRPQSTWQMLIHLFCEEFKFVC